MSTPAKPDDTAISGSKRETVYRPILFSERFQSLIRKIHSKVESILTLIGRMDSEPVYLTPQQLWSIRLQSCVKLVDMHCSDRRCDAARYREALVDVMTLAAAAYLDDERTTANPRDHQQRKERKEDCYNPTKVLPSYISEGMLAKFCPPPAP